MKQKVVKMSHVQKTLLVSCSVVGLSVFVPHSAMSQDIVIDEAVTETNGGNVLNTGETLTVTGEGSIITTDTGPAIQANQMVDADGDPVVDATFIPVLEEDSTVMIEQGGRVEAVSVVGDLVSFPGIGVLVGDNSRVVNAGEIVTRIVNPDNLGEFFFSGLSGIQVGDDSTVENSGSIITAGAFSAGILGANNVNIDSSGSIETDGEQSTGIAVGDNSEVRMSGTIVTRGQGAIGIAVGTIGSMIDVSGDITTSGFGAVGIFLDGPADERGGSRVDHSGSIRTTGEDAAGIVVLGGDGHMIDASGDITTSGDGATGILVEPGTGDAPSRVDHSGSIRTTGDGAEGINIAGDTTLIHTGVIRTEGGSVTLPGVPATATEPEIPETTFFSHGIVLQTGATAIVSGLVETTGDGSSGIVLETEATLVHTGLVRVTGEGSHALDAGVAGVASENDITVDGTLISEQGNAINLQGSGTSLLLEDRAFLVGGIALGTDTARTINRNANHSIYWVPENEGTGQSLDPDNSAFGGSAVYFVRDTDLSVATYDPSGLLGAVDSVGDLTRQLSFANSTTNYGFWIKGLGGNIDHEASGNALERNVDHYGVVVGYNWDMPSTGLQLGGFAGYAGTDITASSSRLRSFDVEGDGFVAGFGGSQSFGEGASGHGGNIVLNFGFNFGLQSYDAIRLINDNRADDGIASARSSYDSWFVAPEVGISGNIEVAERLMFKPSFGIRYINQWIDGHTETGESANANVEDHSVGVFEFTPEIALVRGFFGGGDISGRLGYISRNGIGGNDVNIRLNGQTQNVDYLRDSDSDTFYAGLGSMLEIFEGSSIILDGKYYFGGDFDDGLQGAVTVSINF